MKKILVLVATASGLLFAAGCCPRTLVLGLQLMRVFGQFGGQTTPQ